MQLKIARSKFRWSVTHTDEDGTEREIVMGTQSKNEDLKDDQSATQYLKDHSSELVLNTINFIDKPGIGDIRGTPKDMENCDNILTFFLNYEKINAVCVLMKQNSSQLTIASLICTSHWRKTFSSVSPTPTPTMKT